MNSGFCAWGSSNLMNFIKSDELPDSQAHGTPEEMDKLELHDRVKKCMKDHQADTLVVLGAIDEVMTQNSDLHGATQLHVTQEVDAAKTNIIVGVDRLLEEKLEAKLGPITKALGLTEDCTLKDFKVHEAMIQKRRISWEHDEKEARVKLREEAAEAKLKRKEALAQAKAAKSVPTEPAAASSSSKPPVAPPVVELEAEAVEEPAERPQKRPKRVFQCNDCEAPPFETKVELQEHLQAMCLCPNHNPTVLIPKAAFKKDGAKNESKTRVNRIFKAYVAQGTKVMGTAPKLLKKFGEPNEWLVEYAEAHEKAIHEIKLANKGRFEDEPVPEPVEEVSGGADGDVKEPIEALGEVAQASDGSEVVMM